MEQAIALSERHLDGRRLLIKSGSNFDGRPNASTSHAGVSIGSAEALLQQALGSGSGTTSTSPSATQATNDPALAAAMSKTSQSAIDHLLLVATGGSRKPNRDGTATTGITKTAAKILRAQKHAPAPTLFVGNLPFDTTEDGLREMVQDAAEARMRKYADLMNPNRKKGKKGKGKNGREQEDGDSSSEESSDGESDSDEEETEAAKKADSDSSSSSSSDSDDESAEEEDDAETKAQKAKQSQHDAEAAAQNRARGAGIRKIRLGTFEDAPTKCKGWAFIDFHTIAHAAATLIDYPRAYHYLGRTLVLQFAGADAVRRGLPRGPLNGEGRAARREAGGANGRDQQQQLKGGAPRGPRPPPPVDPKVLEQRAAERKKLAESAPAPGTFDPDAPIPKKHKETQQERQARRERERAEKKKGK